MEEKSIQVIFLSLFIVFVLIKGMANGKLELRLCETVTDPYGVSEFLSRDIEVISGHISILRDFFALLPEGESENAQCHKIRYFDPVPQVTILALERGTGSTDKKVILLH